LGSPSEQGKAASPGKAAFLFLGGATDGSPRAVFLSSSFHRSFLFRPLPHAVRTFVDTVRHRVAQGLALIVRRAAPGNRILVDSLVVFDKVEHLFLLLVLHALPLPVRSLSLKYEAKSNEVNNIPRLLSPPRRLPPRPSRSGGGSLSCIRTRAHRPGMPAGSAGIRCSAAAPEAARACETLKPQGSGSAPDRPPRSGHSRCSALFRCWGDDPGPRAANLLS
jgi:hypothetical protein